jgi:hypothetical protein
MPLFFLIAIGAGAFTVGAATVDLTADARQHEKARMEQTTNVQPQAYTTDAAHVAIAPSGSGGE